MIDTGLLREIDLAPLSASSDKNERGQVLVVAGGRSVPGAACLVGLAGLRAGAGKLALASTSEAAVALGLAVPEAAIIRVSRDAHGEFSARAPADLLTAAAKADALVVGPGMMHPENARAMALGLLARTRGPMVIDAGALPRRAGAVPFATLAAGRVVLTPHAGEMAGMLDTTKEEVLEDPLRAARTAATLFQSVVVMKGSTTWVVSPSGSAWRHEGGVPGLGTSGSGDVLAGAIGGFAAQGHPPMNAAAWGVYVHAEAGSELAAAVGPLGFLARELLNLIPRVRGRVSERDQGPARRVAPTNVA